MTVISLGGSIGEEDIAKNNGCGVQIPMRGDLSRNERERKEEGEGSIRKGERKMTDKVEPSNLSQKSPVGMQFLLEPLFSP